MLYSNQAIHASEIQLSVSQEDISAIIKGVNDVCKQIEQNKMKHFQLNAKRSCLNSYSHSILNHCDSRKQFENHGDYLGQNLSNSSSEGEFDLPERQDNLEN